MSLYETIKSRQIQKKANSFIDSLKNKSDKEIEQAYLNSKDLENNEIVLSYIFFNHTSLIRILPIEFQKSRINSNLNMFKYGSTEAKKELVSTWLHENKFFMNALVVELSEEEYDTYISLYFKQSEDVALLYMEDLKKVIEILSRLDLKKTELLIDSIKDKLVDRQWEYIIEVNPLFIKYASQTIQNKYSEDEKYISYLSGEARDKYAIKQVDKIKNDFSLFENSPIDVQTEYIRKYPYMINYLKDNELIEILKYDIDLIKYVNLSGNKNKDDKTQEVVCSILENLNIKSTREIINMLVNKCVLNAKGKLYRFDFTSNDISYQYTKRIVRLLQDLTIEQMKALIMVDVNYALPYVIPVYKDDTDRKEKEKITIDCNKRCLTLFKAYFGEEIYTKYYKSINKIYAEYIANIERHDWAKDYRCVFELLKVLFNKKIITNNNPEKISLFIGTSLLYKDDTRDQSRSICIKLLNELLSVAYNKQIDNNREIYNISSLELFDDRLSFISPSLLLDYSKYNFVNISNLLLIIKSDKAYKTFKIYYEILINIFGENKETLYRAVENFNYYREIIEDVKDKDLNDEEIDNLTILLATTSNQYNITKKEELASYDLILYKKLVSEISSIKDQDAYKNLLCNYLFNKGYDEKGNSGWLEVVTIKSICELFDSECLDSLVINSEKVFEKEEVDLFTMTKLLFSSTDFDVLLSFTEKFMVNHVKRNILSVSELFNKIKKYRVELINNEIVSIDEIEDLYLNRPDIVIKSNRDGVTIYTIIGQDFRVLCSNKDDGIHYMCTNVNKLEKNQYGYNKLYSDGSIRFSLDDGKTTIKVYENNMNKEAMKAEFIIVVGKLTDELLNIAKENNLKVVEIQN